MSDEPIDTTGWPTYVLVRKEDLRVHRVEHEVVEWEASFGSEDAFPLEPGAVITSKDGKPVVTALLTDDELELMNKTAQVANLMYKVIGDGPQSEHDWAEAAHHIHNIQHMVMAQAAARAYPDLFRLMGKVIPRD